MSVYSDPTPIATAEQFEVALLAVRDGPRISPAQLKMLRAHWRAPKHILSTEGLAQAAGYSSFSSANMQYGMLAREVLRALRIELPPAPDGNPHWWRTLAYGNDGAAQVDDGRYEWIMRPELAQALQKMKWT